MIILHTNDFHNRMPPRAAEHIKKSKADMQAVLLDAGDAISAGNIVYNPCEPILEKMTSIGYDAMCMGNREFHFTRVGFETKVKDAGFPVLCANVHPKHEGDRPVVDWIMLERGDKKIAVAGLTVPMITPTMKSAMVSSWLFEPPLQAARRVASAVMLEKPDLLVFLTHIGIAQDRLLANAVPKIDLIIGGHTHTTLETGERVNNTLIVQTGAYCRNLGIVDWNTETGELTARLEAL